MPIIKSAKKRVRTAEKAAIRNSKTKRTLKAAIKSFRAKVSGDTQAAAQSSIDTAVKKGLMHKNKAARQKAQLAKAAKAAGTTPSTAKKAAPKKTTAKPAAAKKAPAKSPAKKTTAKATTTKKPAAKK
jgi:ribosomal protein S20